MRKSSNKLRMKSLTFWTKRWISQRIVYCIVFYFSLKNSFNLFRFRGKFLQNFQFYLIIFSRVYFQYVCREYFDVSVKTKLNCKIHSSFSHIQKMLLHQSSLKIDSSYKLQCVCRQYSYKYLKKILHVCEWKIQFFLWLSNLFLLSNVN